MCLQVYILFMYCSTVEEVVLFQHRTEEETVALERILGEDARLYWTDENVTGELRVGVQTDRTKQLGFV